MTPEEEKFFAQPSPPPEEVVADVFGGVETAFALSANAYAFGKVQDVTDSDGNLLARVLVVGTPDKHCYEVWFRDVGIKLDAEFTPLEEEEEVNATPES